MTKDSPDFQVTLVVNTVPTSDNPDWQLTATGPGGAPIAGGGLLACVQYAPAVFHPYATYTDIPAVADATNLTIAFTAPASGKVLVRLTAVAQVLDVAGQTGYWCLMDHTTGAQVGTSVLVENVTSGSTAAQDVVWPLSVPILVTGLTPGGSYQYDWGFMEGSHSAGGFHMYVQGGTGILLTFYAGPAVMEVWSAV